MEPTIQELFSSVSGKEAVDLIRVGEEALIESTQALILAPFSVSNLFTNSILRSSGEKDSATGRDDGGNTFLTPRDFTSRTTTFCWLVILLNLLAYLLRDFKTQNQTLDPDRQKQ